MHRLAVVVLLLLGARGVAAAQDRAAPSARPSSRQDAVLRQLLQVEDSIGIANRNCDYNYFRRVEATEFIYTGADGAVSTRAEDLAGEKDCKKSTYDESVDEPRLLLYGTTAVLNARHTVTLGKSSAPVVRRNRFTDVFVWRDARWQLVAGHSTRIP